jgi:hypothetical protein
MGFWDDAVAPGGDKEFGEIPEGNYPAKVTKAAVNLASKYGPRVELEYQISSGEYYNRRRWSNYNLDHNVGKGMLKRDLELFGLDLKSVEKNEDLGAYLTPIVNKTVEITVKRNPKKDNPAEYWDNTYLNQVVSDRVNSAPTPEEIKAKEPTFDSTEEIPF